MGKLSHAWALSVIVTVLSLTAHPSRDAALVALLFKASAQSSGAQGATLRNSDQIPEITFTTPNMSPAERRAFLLGDYKILRKVSELPKAVATLYTSRDATRIAMADPGKAYEATDLISDLSLPRRRLILAGVAGNRVFVHYELGGRGKSNVLDFFQLKSPEVAVGVWRGYTRKPAASLDALRDQVRWTW